MAQSKNLIVFLGSDSFCTIYNVDTKKFQTFGEEKYLASKNLQFFEHLPSFIKFTKIKAFVFTIYFSDFSTVIEENQFRLKCSEFAQKHGIYYYFHDPHQIDAYAAISQTKTMVKEGEEIMVVNYVSKRISPSHIILKRENDCYKIIEIGCSRSPQFSPSWKKDILGSHKPKAILLMQNKLGNFDLNAAPKMKKLFKGENFKAYCPADSDYYLFTTAAEIVQHLMDEKRSEFAIRSFCMPTFEVRYDGKVLIKASYIDDIPLEKSADIDVDSAKSVSLFCSYEPPGEAKPRPLQLFKEIKLSTFTSKKATVTLKVDSNSFFDLKVESIIDEPTNVAENVVVEEEPLMPDKARMIFDRQNFSVSYFSNNKENIIQDSDGSTEIPIYISFTEKKPIVGKEARNMYAEKPECVIFDIIKLCSITDTNIENPNWEFKISKENDSIMVTMDTIDGERKSSVEFLLALILKNGNDRVKKEYGKKMKDIEIGFNGFTPNETLKNNFMEAGKLLDVNIFIV